MRRHDTYPTQRRKRLQTRYSVLPFSMQVTVEIPDDMAQKLTSAGPGKNLTDGTLF
jgi:hypothetical protein